MHTECYCSTLDALDRIKAIQAIHAAFLQIKALDTIDADSLNFDKVKAQLAECLRDAGHFGFVS
ncbi:hypothetical protein [EBPR siphovirus 5]|nr:hypothetical protein [EBPR siphovirus 5]